MFSYKIRNTKKKERERAAKARKEKIRRRAKTREMLERYVMSEFEREGGKEK